MTLVLLYSCVATPVQIALYEQITGYPQVINWVVDILFLIDIFVIFNSALIDEDLKILEDRLAIAKAYMSGFFIIDVIAIIPFDLLVNGPDG